MILELEPLSVLLNSYLKNNVEFEPYALLLKKKNLWVTD